MCISYCFNINLDVGEDSPTSELGYFRSTYRDIYYAPWTLTEVIQTSQEDLDLCNTLSVVWDQPCRCMLPLHITFARAVRIELTHPSLDLGGGGFAYSLRFSTPPLKVFGVWTLSSPYTIGAPRKVSTLARICGGYSSYSYPVTSLTTFIVQFHPIISKILPLKGALSGTELL